MTLVKICGITNLEDALLSLKFGADMLGFNFFKGSSRYLSPNSAKYIVSKLPPGTIKVGVFVNESLDRILKVNAVVGLNCIQLHGDETPEFVENLKTSSNLEVIKVLRVRPDFRLSEIEAYIAADAILFDSYSPDERGGTGETFDWKQIRKAKSTFSKVYVAGGLHPKNVGLVVRRIQPFAVDACSRLEKEKGKKDKKKLFQFVSAAKLGKSVFTINDIYDVLTLIELYPSMYLGRPGLTSLFNYLTGFEAAVRLSGSRFDTKHFFDEFGSWSIKKLTKRHESPLGWLGVILRDCSDNEVEALEMFFVLLSEFKVRRERLLV